MILWELSDIGLAFDKEFVNNGQELFCYPAVCRKGNVYNFGNRGL